MVRENVRRSKGTPAQITGGSSAKIWSNTGASHYNSTTAADEKGYARNRKAIVRIGILADRTGTTVPTIRYYEHLLGSRHLGTIVRHCRSREPHRLPTRPTCT